MVEEVTNTRAQRAEALEAWADRIDSAELKEADTETLRAIAELAETRNGVDEQLTDAVRSARHARRSWSEIGTMLGVSKQAAQRKYGPKISA